MCCNHNKPFNMFLELLKNTHYIPNYALMFILTNNEVLQHWSSSISIAKNKIECHISKIKKKISINFYLNQLFAYPILTDDILLYFFTDFWQSSEYTGKGAKLNVILATYLFTNSLRESETFVNPFVRAYSVMSISICKFLLSASPVIYSDIEFLIAPVCPSILCQFYYMEGLEIFERCVL